MCTSSWWLSSKLSSQSFGLFASVVQTNWPSLLMFAKMPPFCQTYTTVERNKNFFSFECPLMSSKCNKISGTIKRKWISKKYFKCFFIYPTFSLNHIPTLLLSIHIALSTLDFSGIAVNVGNSNKIDCCVRISLKWKSVFADANKWCPASLSGLFHIISLEISFQNWLLKIRVSDDFIYFQDQSQA